MFCGNCGTKLADNDKFCGGCGQRQLPNTPVIPVQQVISSNQQSNTQQYGVQPYPAQQTTGYHTTIPEPQPKKKTRWLLTLVSVALVAVIIGAVLWFFVWNTNPLASTCWVSEDGTLITFTDDRNGYYEDNESREKFTYTVNDDQLHLYLDDEDEIFFTFREEGDWLVLTTAYEDEEIAWCNAEKAFFCAYCEEPGYSNKHTGTLDGTEYDFCENCWENVQRFLD